MKAVRLLPVLVTPLLLAACTRNGDGDDTSFVLSESEGSSESSGASNSDPTGNATTLPTTTSTVTTEPPTTDGDTSGATTDSTDSDTDASTSSSTGGGACNHDLTCNADEDADSCLHDCGTGEPDGACVADQETPYSCPQDCEATRCVVDGALDPLTEQCDDGNAVDEDACTNACTVNVCGDGVILPGDEECDDANASNGDGCSALCTREHFLVFVSSLEPKGALLPAIDGKLSLALADAHCQELATTASLPGTYRAWLSDGSEGPATRFGLGPSFAGVFERVDGMPVAHGWSDLVDGTLEAAIDRDETGAPIVASVWTNTTASGAPVGTDHCTKWSSSSSLVKGRVGTTELADARWTDLDANLCSAAARLYCFQVP
ncbi:MAG TPA: DUF4215 domain-containing protein [Nannocystaceae bacterium]|nr:DUF4215 domain-containing protein [Nannocystaceae bacterium]